MRLLNREERTVIKQIDKATVISNVLHSVPTGLVPSLFPERKMLWDSISQCMELKDFIENQVDKYLSLYEKHSKGREKYATLFLSWLDVTRTFTCKSQQTPTALAEWAPVLAKHDNASAKTQTTVLASIFQAIQEHIQTQMATEIDALEEYSFTEEKASDSTALYRISGWAVKSAIDYRVKRSKKNKGEKRSQIEEEIELLKALKRTNSSKVTLPVGAQYLDRGGLTFVKSTLLPWLCALEESIKVNLNQKGYQKYGRTIFKVRRNNVPKQPIHVYFTRLQERV